jgi:hypothetical protein
VNFSSFDLFGVAPNPLRLVARPPLPVYEKVVTSWHRVAAGGLLFFSTRKPKPNQFIRLKIARRLVPPKPIFQNPKPNASRVDCFRVIFSRRVFIFKAVLQLQRL